jgi:protein arginine N-methyltransferase 1
VEEVQLPVDKVDIIISEWMGYFLLYEAMLDTVLFARDKWLKADGLMFPDRAVMYLAAIEDADYKEEKIGFWDNVYGVNMSSIKAWALLEPLVDVVDKDLLNTDYCPILDIDLKTVTVPQLDFSSEYNVQFRRNDKVHGLAVWFDVFFSFSTPSVKLSTSKELILIYLLGPYNRETHWKQTVFYLNDVLTVKKGDTMSGSIAAKKSKSNPRELDIKISYHIDNESQKLNASQFYRLC